jgi:trehalose-6-phosphate synthase
MKMIVGRDKLDEVQGVRQKLLAFEMFLEKYPEFQGRVVLIQVALATTEENEHQVAVFDVVSRINSRFSTLTYQVMFLPSVKSIFNQIHSSTAHRISAHPRFDFLTIPRPAHCC